MIRSNLAPEVQMPEEPDADATIAQTEIYKRRLAVAITREENIRSQRSWVKSYLWNLCSPSSKNKIKEWENYQAIEDEDDACELWTAIRQYHFGTTTGNEELDREQALQVYYSLRQYDYESIVDFHNIFKAALEVMQDTECDVPNDQAQATAFFMRLDDKRYGQLKADIRNKVVEHPADLNSAFKQAAERVEVSTRAHSIVPSEQLMHVRDEPNSRHNLNSGRGGGRGGERGTGHGTGRGANGRGQGNGRDRDTDRTSEDSAPCGGNRDSDRRKDRGGRGNKRSERRDKQCLCGSRNHTADNCPQGDRIRQLLREDKEAEHRDKQCLCGSRNHTADNCPQADRIRQLLREDKEAERAMTQFRHATDDDDEERTMTVTAYELPLLEIVALAGPRALPRGSVLLDNQSTIHLFQDGGFLNNVRQAARAVRISGVGGSVLSRREGDLNHFGTVVYAPQGPMNCNVLSLSRCAVKATSITSAQ